MVTLRQVGTLSVLTLALGLATACGSDSDNEDENTSTDKPALAWADVSPIVTASCTGAGCHGKSGASSSVTVYEDNETNFKAAGTKIAERLNSTNSGLKMPQPPKTISDADKQKLIDFMAQK